MIHHTYAELLKKDPLYLRKLVCEFKTNIMGLRFQKANGSLTKPYEIKKSRRSIARIQTALCCVLKNKEVK